MGEEPVCDQGVPLEKQAAGGLHLQHRQDLRHFVEFLPARGDPARPGHEAATGEAGELQALGGGGLHSRR